MLSFPLAFLVGIELKTRAQTAYWRSYAMPPFALGCFILPWLLDLRFLSVGILAFGTGIIMSAFNDSKIESDSYTVMIASGNYRKMLTA